jgi:hypothetical protein
MFKKNWIWPGYVSVVLSSEIKCAKIFADLAYLEDNTEPNISVPIFNQLNWLTFGRMGIEPSKAL